MNKIEIRFYKIGRKGSINKGRWKVWLCEIGRRVKKMGDKIRYSYINMKMYVDKMSIEYR
jgi:hypothetical protein